MQNVTQRLLVPLLPGLLLLANCSGGDGDAGSTQATDGSSSTTGATTGGKSDAEIDAYLEESLIDAIGIVDAGDKLTDPERDTTVSVVGGTTEIITISDNGTISVSLSFTAENANVVAAGIAFSLDGPIVAVPAPDAQGMTSGTINFNVQFPGDLCDNLGAICHSIVCYEYAITDEGKVSQANFLSMTATCGQCSEPTCAGLDPACVNDKCYDAAGDELPAGELLYELTDVNDLKLSGDYLYFGGPVRRAPADGSGEPEVLTEEIEEASELALAGGQLFMGTPFDGVYRMDAAGGPLTELGDVGDHFVSDGEAVYTYFDWLACAFDDTNTPGLFRLDPSGDLTAVAPDVTCVRDLAVTDTDLYYIAGLTDEEQLWRVPKAGGTPELQQLNVMGWGGDLFYTEGYIVGSSGLTSHARGRPADTEAVRITTDFTLGGNYGSSVFLVDYSSAGSCFVEVVGNNPLLNVGSVTPLRLIGGVQADASHVYYVASNSFFTSSLARIERIAR